MSILTGPEIRRLAEIGISGGVPAILIDPFDHKYCQSNSYDVHLGDTLMMYREPAIDPEADNPTVEHRVNADGRWLIVPGIVYLAVTREYTETHGLAPKLEGRSSVARCGTKVHLTAGFGDDGFCGRWTLEIEATQPTYLRPGMKIAQLCYTTLTGERQPYQGRYQNSDSADPVPSRFHLPDPVSPGG